MTRLLSRLPYHDTAALELALSALAIIWGGWLLFLVALTLATASYTPFTSINFRLFVAVGGGSPILAQTIFGAAALTLGVAGVTAYRRDLHVRMVAVFGFGFWGAVATMFALVEWRTTGVPVYGSISLANLFIVARTTAR